MSLRMRSFWPIRHFAFADTPPAGGAGGDPPPQPPPQPSPVVSAPTTVPPAKPVSQEPESPALSLDQQAMVRDANGNIVTRTLGEIVDGWRSSPSAEDRENFALFKKAVSTGPDSQAAAIELMQKLSPGASVATPEGTSVVETSQAVASPQASDVLSQLTERLAVLEKTITERVSPFLGQVDHISRLSQIKAGFAAAPEKFPMLGKVQQGASMVLAQEGVYRNKVATEGVNYDTLPSEVKQKILVRSMEDVEKHLGVLHRELGGAVPSAGSSSNVVSVNDQVSGTSPEHRPPRVRLDDHGNLITGEPSAPLPATPVTPPTGTMVGAESPQEKGPQTPTTLREQMRRRITTVSSPG